MEIPRVASAASMRIAAPSRNHRNNQLRLGAGRAGTSSGPGADLTSMRAQHGGDTQQGLFGHVADGRVGEHAESS
nr:hypothetical protein [Candidatus Mycobacterium methanotrophicum]